MAATSPPGGAGGNNFLTRKLGPLPMWVWIAGGVAVIYWYKSRSSSSSSSSAQNAVTQALAAQGVSADQYGISGADIGSMLEQLQSQVSMLGAGNSGGTGSGAPSPGNTQTGAANQTAPAFVKSSGPVTPGSAGKYGYNWISSPSTLQSLEAAGIPVYYEIPVLGGAQFVQWKKGASVPNINLPGGAKGGQPYYYTWAAP